MNFNVVCVSVLMSALVLPSAFADSNPNESKQLFSVPEVRLLLSQAKEVAPAEFYRYRTTLKRLKKMCEQTALLRKLGHDVEEAQSILQSELKREKKSLLEDLDLPSDAPIAEGIEAFFQEIKTQISGEKFSDVASLLGQFVD